MSKLRYFMIILLAALSHAEILPAASSGRHITLDQKALFAIEVIDSNIRNIPDDVYPRGLQGALKIAVAVLSQAIAGQNDETVSYTGKTLNALAEKMEHVCLQFPILQKDKKVIETLAEYNNLFGRASRIVKNNRIDPRLTVFPLETGIKPILVTSTLVSHELVEEWGNSLCLAAESGDLEEVRRLLSTRVVNVDFMDTESCTPLLRALLWGHFDVADFLYENGADPAYVNPKSGCSILHIAALDQNEPVIEWLIAHGVDINILMYGRAIMTALDFVEAYRASGIDVDSAFVDWLLSKGALRWSQILGELLSCLYNRLQLI